MWWTMRGVAVAVRASIVLTCQAPQGHSPLPVSQGAASQLVDNLLVGRSNLAGRRGGAGVRRASRRGCLDMQKPWRRLPPMPAAGARPARACALRLPSAQTEHTPAALLGKRARGAGGPGGNWPPTSWCSGLHRPPEAAGGSRRHW